MKLSKPKAYIIFYPPTLLRELVYGVVFLLVTPLLPNEAGLLDEPLNSNLGN